MAINLNETKHYQLSRTLGEAIRYMSPGEPLPTILELKKKYNVSQVTISQALDRLRAQGIVERLPFGRKRLAVSRAGVRPLFRVTLMRPLWSSPDFDTVTNAIYTLGLEQNFQFSLHVFSDIANLNCEEVLRNSDAGLVIGEPTVRKDLITAFNRSRKPLVFLRDKPDGVRANSIWIDDKMVGQMATQHLLDLGHERIVVMLSEPSNPSSLGRMRGWEMAMQKKGIRDYENLIADCSTQPGKNAIQNSYERFDAWLDTNPAPFTGLFCVGWTGALAALRALRERNIAVPGQVSVITFDSESALCDFANPRLTALTLNLSKYAHEAIQLVQQAINDHSRQKIQKLIMKPILVPRQSTGPVPVAIPGGGISRS